MGSSQNDQTMEGWLYLIRSNRIGLQYSRKRYFVLQGHLLQSFKSVPVSGNEVLPQTFITCFSSFSTCFEFQFTWRNFFKKKRGNLDFFVSCQIIWWFLELIFVFVYGYGYDGLIKVDWYQSFDHLGVCSLNPVCIFLSILDGPLWLWDNLLQVVIAHTLTLSFLQTCTCTTRHG